MRPVNVTYNRPVVFDHQKSNYITSYSSLYVSILIILSSVINTTMWLYMQNQVSPLLLSVLFYTDMLKKKERLPAQLQDVSLPYWNDNNAL